MGRAKKMGGKMPKEKTGHMKEMEEHMKEMGKGKKSMMDKTKHKKR